MSNISLKIDGTEYKLATTGNFFMSGPLPSFLMSKTPRLIFDGNVYEGEAIPNKPEPTFITEDGIEVYGGLKVAFLSTKTWLIATATVPHNANLFKGDTGEFKYFSSKAAAEEYVRTHKPGPLFTTEDGVPIFTNDTYWSLAFDCPVLEWNWIAIEQKADYTHEGMEQKKPPLGRKQFSTKKAAEDWILMNKPVLSVNDVIKVRGNRDFIGTQYLTDLLTDIVKDHLKLNDANR